MGEGSCGCEEVCGCVRVCMGVDGYIQICYSFLRWSVREKGS